MNCNFPLADTCGRSFDGRKHLEKHIPTHFSEPTFMCAVCGSKYFTALGLKKHSCGRAMSIGSRKKVLNARYCRYCKATFQNSEEKKNHKCQYQHPLDPKLVFCRYCDQVMTKNRFGGHIDEFHSEGDWTCKVCKHLCSSERSLTGETCIIVN